MKKTLKAIGIGFLAVLLISIIIALLNTDTTVTEAQEATVIVDSLELKNQARIKDSLDLIKKERKEKAVKQLEAFNKKEDEFQGTAFYRDKRTPYYTNVNFIYPYIVEKDSNFWLRLKMQYAADDWLFINNAILLIDDEKFTITGNWQRDNNSDIWEWLDISVSNTELSILEKLTNSKTAKVRYVGNQYHDDRNITSKEKDIIKKTLEVFKDLN